MIPVAALVIGKQDQVAGLRVDSVCHLEGCQQYDLAVEPLGQAEDVDCFTRELVNALHLQNRFESGFYLVLPEFAKDFELLHALHVPATYDEH